MIIFFSILTNSILLVPASLSLTEEPTEKRYRLVTVLQSDDDDDFDDDDGPAISRSKSDVGKAAAKRLMTKRSSNH